ncbi:hypothetical protein ACJMK2_024338 [Sinanodonta woodiana]|uniref:Granulins domain-containing protein n=1 Tax=Sinanodonta woodiana TaxID=1069815 RepID=A0ABD3T7Y6_SINWO
MLIIWAMCMTMTMTTTMANSLFIQIMNDESNALCPDEQTRCPADHECCKLEGGEIGCCLKQEVQGIKALPFIQSNTLSIAYNKTSETLCPDPSYSCPGTQTCCASSGSSHWACCAYYNAVCCKDGKTCCPCGYRCAVGKCVRNEDKTETKESEPFIPRIPSVMNASNDTNGTPCPNPSYVCPGVSTCCPSYYGKPWGCCSGRNAVCCSDGRHCCPSGYICSTCKCVKA